MLGKTLLKRFLKKMGELQFGLGPQSTVEFHFGNTPSIKIQRLFARGQNGFTRESFQFFDGNVFVVQSALLADVLVCGR
jgi:hypothetical protein